MIIMTTESPPLTPGAAHAPIRQDDDTMHGFAPRCAACLISLTATAIRSVACWECTGCGLVRIS